MPELQNMCVHTFLLSHIPPYLCARIHAEFAAHASDDSKLTNVPTFSQPLNISAAQGRDDGSYGAGRKGDVRGTQRQGHLYAGKQLALLALHQSMSCNQACVLKDRVTST